MLPSIESLIKQELSIKLGVGTYLLPQYFDRPISVGRTLERQYSTLRTIQTFFSIVSSIGKEALMKDDKLVKRILFSESPIGMTVDYHSQLPDCCWKMPIMFRTDESVSGKIYEIQAPGSGWGDLFLYSKCFQKLGYQIPSYLLHFPEYYAQNIIYATKHEHPKVFHMTDAASVPYSARYLMAITDRIEYWGTNENVSMRNVDCSISHSVISTVSANYFHDYLDRAAKGDFTFAIQPNLIFDEKAIYVLPFYRYTRECFPDSVRALFPYTTFLEGNGFYDQNDNFISIANFIERKPADRRYYLKYGGPDTNRNWGSKAVFRLSGNDCSYLLTKAAKLAEEGEVWLIQEDCSSNFDCEEFPPDFHDLHTNKKMNVKLSSFYGIQTFFGIKIMARHHFKVHGQKDTYVGLGI